MSTTKFCNITLKWNYNEDHVTLSMSWCIEKALQCFTHSQPKRPQHSPHCWIPLEYRATIQCDTLEDNTLPLDSKGIKCLQEVIGTPFFSTRAVDNTMLVTGCGPRHTDWPPPKQKAPKVQCKPSSTCWIMQPHTWTWSFAFIKAQWSYMSIVMHHTWANQKQCHACEDISIWEINLNEPTDIRRPNGPIHVESHILKHVIAAPSKADIVALFHTSQEAAHFCQFIHELNRMQPGPTPIMITTDNSNANGFANKRTKIKMSKAMNMGFIGCKIEWRKDN
jgi:hypothetical protein